MLIFVSHREGWICSAINTTYPATFDYGHPPILLINIRPMTKRIDEGYEPNPVRLRDLKPMIKVGIFEYVIKTFAILCLTFYHLFSRYKLRAVVHHTLNPAHFTATIIGSNNILYLYDDLHGVKEVRSSTNPIVCGIYSEINDY